MDSEREVRNVRVSVVEMQSTRNLISWINETLETKIRELSDLSTGAIYCQLMHSLWRRSMCLSKVHFNTNDQWEHLSNYKLLKKSFQKMDLIKDIPERQLQQGRGHVDFANWFYKLYMVNKSNEPYDAASARKGAIIGKGERKSRSILDRSHSLVRKPAKIIVDEAHRSRSLINVGNVPQGKGPVTVTIPVPVPVTVPVPVKPKPVPAEIQPRRKLREGRKSYYDDSRPIALVQVYSDEDDDDVDENVVFRRPLVQIESDEDVDENVHVRRPLIQVESEEDVDEDYDESNEENTVVNKPNHLSDLEAKCEYVRQIALDQSLDSVTAMMKITSFVIESSYDVGPGEDVTENWTKIQEIMSQASESFGSAIVEIDNIFSGKKSGDKTPDSFI